MRLSSSSGLERRRALVDEGDEFAGLVFGGFGVGGEASLGEIVGDFVAVRAADFEGDGELLHECQQFGLGDGGGEDFEVGEGVRDVGGLGGGRCGGGWLLRGEGCAGEVQKDGEQAVSLH